MFHPSMSTRASKHRGMEQLNLPILLLHGADTRVKKKICQTSLWLSKQRSVMSLILFLLTSCYKATPSFKSKKKTQTNRTEQTNKKTQGLTGALPFVSLQVRWGFLEVWEVACGMIFPVLLQHGGSGGRASCCHGAASQVWGFSHICLPSQPERSFMHGTMAKCCTAGECGAFWEVVEEAEAWLCMPAKRLSFSEG